MEPVAAPVRILVVCTGNICRSPMAEVLLRDRLAAVGVVAEVGSAGLLYGDRPASDGAQAAMASRGLDLSAHRSAVLDRPTVAAADLVIAMEPRHVREVVALHDPAWTRTFTLRELARRAETHPPRRPDETLDGWLVRIGEGRRRIDLLGDDDALSVLDPYRQAQAVYDATAVDLAAELDLIVARAWSDTAGAGVGGPTREPVRRAG